MGDDDTTKHAISGFDMDTDELALDLNALSNAIDQGTAYVQEVKSSECVGTDDAVEHTISVTFIPTNEYEGQLRFEYDND